MTWLAKTGASLPPEALGPLVVLAVAIAGMLVLDRLPQDWYGMGPHPKPPRLRRLRPPEPTRLTAPVLPPGPITAPAPVDSNGHGPLGTLAPVERGRYSEEYVAYLKGQLPSPIDGKCWPDRIKPWKDAHRAAGGTCDIAKVLGRGGVPNCGAAILLRTMDTDHIHYDTLFGERRQDVVFGCHSCHMTAERIKRERKASIYELWGLP
jgi:hypothetical protein